MSGERAFIQLLRRRAPLAEGAKQLEDDCALLAIGGETLVLTHDVIVEGVHVLQGMPASDIAWKLVAANMSDLAAKGAEPVGALLGHSLGDDDEGFVEGLAEALKAYGCSLLGGDTVAVPQGSARSWGMTAIGRATHTPVPSRGGAQVGDGIFVTGPIGAAMMAFEALQADRNAPSIAYRRPQARMEEGRTLAPLVTAMMDISDGLLLDAWRMGKASGVNMAIDSAAVPLAAPDDRRDDALRWGEDFELLFTAPLDCALPCEVFRVGTVESGAAPLTLDGTPQANQDGLGYQHGGN